MDRRSVSSARPEARGDKKDDDEAARRDKRHRDEEAARQDKRYRDDRNREVYDKHRAHRAQRSLDTAKTTSDDGGKDPTKSSAVAKLATAKKGATKERMPSKQAGKDHKTSSTGASSTGAMPIRVKKEPGTAPAPEPGHPGSWSLGGMVQDMLGNLQGSGSKVVVVVVPPWRQASETGKEEG